MAMQYLHDGVHVAEGVRFIIKVFGEAGCVAIASECFSCSLNRVAKRLPVCPTYALLQSGQDSLYTPDSENLSGVGFLWESSFPTVFVVRNAILSCVILKRLVMPT
jgi:hypothetical protein